MLAKTVEERKKGNMKTTQMVDVAADMFNALVVQAEKILLEAYASKDYDRIEQAITYCKSVIKNGEELLGSFESAEEAEVLCSSSCPFVHSDMESLRTLVQFVTGRNHHPWTFNGADKFDQKVWEAHS